MRLHEELIIKFLADIDLNLNPNIDYIIERLILLGFELNLIENKRKKRIWGVSFTDNLKRFNFYPELLLEIKWIVTGNRNISVNKIYDGILLKEYSYLENSFINSKLPKNIVNYFLFLIYNNYLEIDQQFFSINPIFNEEVKIDSLKDIFLTYKLELDIKDLINELISYGLIVEFNFKLYRDKNYTLEEFFEEIVRVLFRFIKINEKIQNNDIFNKCSINNLIELADNLFNLKVITPSFGDSGLKLINPINLENNCLLLCKYYQHKELLLHNRFNDNCFEVMLHSLEFSSKLNYLTSTFSFLFHLLSRIGNLLIYLNNIFYYNGIALIKINKKFIFHFCLCLETLDLLLTENNLFINFNSFLNYNNNLILKEFVFNCLDDVFNFLTTLKFCYTVIDFYKDSLKNIFKLKIGI